MLKERTTALPAKQKDAQLDHVITIHLFWFQGTHETTRWRFH